MCTSRSRTQSKLETAPQQRWMQHDSNPRSSLVDRERTGTADRHEGERESCRGGGGEQSATSEQIEGVGRRRKREKIVATRAHRRAESTERRKRGREGERGERVEGKNREANGKGWPRSARRRQFTATAARRPPAAVAAVAAAEAGSTAPAAAAAVQPLPWPLLPILP